MPYFWPLLFLNLVGLELPEPITEIDTIPIQAADLQSVVCIKVQSPDRYFVLDAANPSVLVLNSEGVVEAVIGRKGQGPGEFNFPLSIDMDEKNLYVIDPKTQRLHLFDIDTFAFKLSYFTIDGRDLALTKDYAIMTAPQLETDNTVHWFSKQGKLAKQSLKIPDIAKDHQLISGDTSIDLDAAGNIYALHQMEYRIYKLNPKGKLIHSFPGNHRIYVPPPEETFTKFRSRKKTNEWLSHWTHLYELAVSQKNRHLYVGLLHMDPSFHALDVYDLEGNFLGGWKTGPNRFKSVDSEGYLYFVKEVMNDQDAPFHLVKATLNGLEGLNNDGR